MENKYHWGDLDFFVLRAKVSGARGLLEDFGQRRKTCLSEMETTRLLNLQRAEVVQKRSREMLAALSICFQEPPVSNIKRHLYPQGLGARE